MNTSGFWWILLATALYGLIHSLLAANSAKAWAEKGLGEDTTHRYYRLFFVFMAIVTFLPVLLLAALLPDAVLYTIPAPWVYLTAALQGLAGLGILVGVLQTGALNFLGIRQWLVNDSTHSQPRPEKLVVDGFYQWVRHPLYTFSLIFLWLAPRMSWNLLALNLGLSAYMLIGSVFEERKLVEQFGKAYEEYRRRTPMIVPGLKLRR